MPKNYRAVPERITAKLTTIKSTSVVVACLLKLSKAGIKGGKFAHLGITLKNDELHYPKSVIPRYDVGRTSKINTEGLEVIRKDLPAVTKSYSIEAPNYGDWSKGSHEMITNPLVLANYLNVRFSGIKTPYGRSLKHLFYENAPHVPGLQAVQTLNHASQFFRIAGASVPAKAIKARMI